MELLRPIASLVRQRAETNCNFIISLPIKSATKRQISRAGDTPLARENAIAGQNAAA